MGEKCRATQGLPTVQRRASETKKPNIIEHFPRRTAIGTKISGLSIEHSGFVCLNFQSLFFLEISLEVGTMGVGHHFLPVCALSLSVVDPVHCQNNHNYALKHSFRWI